MHENDSAMPRQHDIGLARKIGDVQSKSESQVVNQRPNAQFRLRVLALDPRHSLTSLLARQAVRHAPSGGASVRPNDSEYLFYLDLLGAPR
jgi:hypothetical protein